MVDPGAPSRGRVLLSEEVSHFSGKMMVPIVLPLQPSQSSPSSETCQLNSYRSKRFAANHCHATLPLHRSWMHGSNTEEDLCTRAGDLQGKSFSLQGKGWDLVTGDVHSLCCGCPFSACIPALPCRYTQKRPCFTQEWLLTTVAPAFFHSHGYLPAAEG